MSCHYAVIKKKRLELHFPVDKEKPKVNSVKEQVKDTGAKICAVDLNIGAGLAVAAYLKATARRLPPGSSVVAIT